MVIVKKSMTTNVSVLLLLLVLSAAFETVDHNIILDRLSQRFGIVGHTLKWFACSLADYQQTTYKWLSVITKKPLMRCAPREVKSVFVISRHGWPLIN